VDGETFGSDDDCGEGTWSWLTLVMSGFALSEMLRTLPRRSRRGVYTSAIPLAYNLLPFGGARSSRPVVILGKNQPCKPRGIGAVFGQVIDHEPDVIGPHLVVFRESSSVYLSSANHATARTEQTMQCRVRVLSREYDIRVRVVRTALVVNLCNTICMHLASMQYVSTS